jgi:hypothetical protein
VLISGALLASCASGQQRPSGSQQPRAALIGYVKQAEPIRLAVNRLLDGADPITEGFRDHRITAAEAGRRMGALERRFAAYAVDVEAIRPATPELRALHAEYAHTYILEDAYLSALANGLANRKLDGLPNTEAVQRDAIIAWRTGLMVLARQTGTHLPADLQLAGRGEIRPSPGGS